MSEKPVSTIVAGKVFFILTNFSKYVSSEALF